MCAPGGRRHQFLDHGGVAEPFAGDGHSIAALSDIAARREEIARGVGSLDCQFLRAARARKFLDRVRERATDALTCKVWTHIEHVEDRIVFQRRKACNLAAKQRDEGERPREPRCESALVVSRRDPRLTLILVIIFGRKLLDAGAKQRRERRRVSGKKRPKTRLRHDHTTAKARSRCQATKAA